MAVVFVQFRADEADLLPRQMSPHALMRVLRGVSTLVGAGIVTSRAAQCFSVSGAQLE